MSDSSTLTLVVRRVIAASPARLFEAWTTPAQLVAWWGPRDVRCTVAEVDARAGGRYRIGNLLPTGETLFITGEFLAVEPPTRLVYSWTLEPGGGSPERVTVRFEPRGPGQTEVIVLHERIASEPARTQHAAGWEGCLDGLGSHISATSPPQP